MQTTTYNRARIHFEAPEAICPGEAFPLHFTIENDTTAELEASSLLLSFERCTPLLDTAFIDGIAVASGTFERAEDGMMLRTPPLMPREQFSLHMHVIAPLPFLEHTAGVSYTLFVPGERLSDQRVLKTVQSVNFEDRYCALQVDGDKEIAKGEARRVRIRVRNTGSAIARDVAVDLRPQGFRIDRMAQLGTMVPGERRDIEAVIVADTSGGKRPYISPVLTWPEGSLEFDKVDFALVQEPAFDASSRMQFVSDQPLSPTGGSYDVAITLRNVGKRPSVAPIVHLDLPFGTELLSDSLVPVAESVLAFPDIPGGEVRERIIHLRSRAAEAIEIGARVDECHLETLQIPVRVVRSLALTELKALSESVVGDTIPVSIHVLNDGNASLDYARLALRHVSSHLSYVPGSLRVNGTALADERFTRDGTMGFRRVQPGALMAIEFAFEAKRPTVHGQTAGIGMQLLWPEGERSISLPALAIRPAQADVGSLFEIDDGEPIVELPSQSVRLAETAAAPISRVQELPQASTTLPRPQPDATSIADKTHCAFPDPGPVKGASGITYLGVDDDATPEPSKESKSAPGESASLTPSVQPIGDLHPIYQRIAAITTGDLVLGEHDIVVGMLLPDADDTQYSQAASAWRADIDGSEAAIVDPATFALADHTKSTVTACAGVDSFDAAIEHFVPTVAAAYPEPAQTAITRYLQAVAAAHRDGSSPKAALDDLLTALAA